jgi:adenosylhomocysteine nucleosidase
MMLRWLVTNYLRQAARQRVQEAVAGAVRQGAEAQPQTRREIGDLRPEIAFVFSTGLEAEAMAGLLEERRTARFPSFREHVGLLDGRLVAVAETGPGPDAAGTATTDLLSMHRPDWVVSSGFAAALSEALDRGHIIMADQLADPSGRCLSLGLKMDPESVRTVRGLHIGRLLGVDHLVGTPEEKRKLGQMAEALACDMESVAVADACRQVKTRCLVVRVISDAVDDRLTKEQENLIAQPSLAGKLGAVTGAVLKRPLSVAEMWKLRDEGTRLSARLAKYLRSVAQQLTDTQNPRKTGTIHRHDTD